ncbi:hypothetical protein BVC80_949g14 [Macleaya cordata]|uniref:Uncharacterized protein n=1 Tax=Macleaya cordata TaxID=56857 RepID=A0A200QX38_MACCD|nr:hypothetical protein BVC80_949g14 [Macleaya cordata]
MENRDSDQSISEDEDDVGINLPTNPRSGNNKDGLEMLTFQDGNSKFMQSSTKVFTSNSDEEISDVEENNVPTNTSFISKAIKFQKDHFNNYESKNQDEASTWFTVHKEAEELIFLHDNAGCFSSRAVNSEPKKILKGSRGKAKPKFSIHFLSHKAEHSLSSMAKDENEKSSKILQMDEGLEDLEDIVMEHSITDLLEGLQEEKTKQSEVQVLANLSALEHRDTEHSMAELLEGLQGKNEPVKRTSELNTKTRSRMHKITRKRNMYQLGDKILDNEDPAEPMDSDTSSEDEAVKFLLQANGQNQMKLASQETKGQTMADRIHKALDATAVNDGGSLFATSKQTGMGYNGRLQQIMQTEKERHVEFLKQSQGMSMHDETKCITVKILSRYLDAKLTVCQCSCVENNKSSHCAESPLNSIGYGPKRTIIFSSRMCSNIEIEVGNFIRIHPPWYEHYNYFRVMDIG